MDVGITKCVIQRKAGSYIVADDAEQQAAQSTIRCGVEIWHRVEDVLQQCMLRSDGLRGR